MRSKSENLLTVRSTTLKKSNRFHDDAIELNSNFLISVARCPEFWGISAVLEKQNRATVFSKLAETFVRLILLPFATATPIRGEHEDDELPEQIHFQTSSLPQRSTNSRQSSNLQIAAADSSQESPVNSAFVTANWSARCLIVQRVLYRITDRMINFGTQQIFLERPKDSLIFWNA